MSYTDSLVHELLDAMVRRWIDEHIDYIGGFFYRPPQNHHEK